MSSSNSVIEEPSLALSHDIDRLTPENTLSASSDIGGIYKISIAI
jgi:hypothetical protein